MLQVDSLRSQLKQMLDSRRWRIKELREIIGSKNGKSMQNTLIVWDVAAG